MKKRMMWSLNVLQRSFHINILRLYSFLLKLFCLCDIPQTRWEISGGLGFVVVGRCSWSSLRPSLSLCFLSISKIIATHLKMGAGDTAMLSQFSLRLPAKGMKLADVMSGRSWTGGSLCEGELQPFHNSTVTLWFILFPGSRHFLILTDVVFWFFFLFS